MKGLIVILPFIFLTTKTFRSCLRPRQQDSLRSTLK